MGHCTSSKYDSFGTGKQLVYHALQDTADETSSEELHAMDENIAALRDERATLKAREKGSRSELSAFGSVVSTTALSTNVSALEVEETALEGRLATLHAAGNKAVSNEEKAAVEATWNTWQKHAATRKKICREMWERCLEALPEGQTKEQHWVSHGSLRFKHMLLIVCRRVLVSRAICHSSFDYADAVALSYLGTRPQRFRLHCA